MNSFLPLLLVAGLVCVNGANLGAVFCGPVCMIYCQYDNVMDERGCPTCKCNSAPLIKEVTTEIATPVMEEVTTEKACPQVMCMIYCANGYLLGSDGCPKCGCN
ncbi:antistasin-like isoform X3 [Mizuhopecten yessoensis]|uniref:antistasin-like isoform X1 n=1 Tax=Mizuhopecten yessoensis TaxID=6573 RepID=UPI000B45F610|nr:antistasin-like isoform X1 [Mizuhopecten yessoensis]XP_021377887.1 antistasin-like isoform X2 [Mizuhopecten yessoensis]XP_021377888.1 antistasin-like isoform X3 [Mizuhopecten yessoensis]